MDFQGLYKERNGFLWIFRDDIGNGMEFPYPWGIRDLPNKCICSTNAYLAFFGTGFLWVSRKVIPKNPQTGCNNPQTGYKNPDMG